MVYNNLLIRHAQKGGEGDRGADGKELQLSPKGITDSIEYGRKLAEWYGPEVKVHINHSGKDRASETSKNIGSGLDGLVASCNIGEDKRLTMPNFPKGHTPADIGEKAAYEHLVTTNHQEVYNVAQRHAAYILDTLEKGTDKQVNVGIGHSPAIDLFLYAVGVRNPDTGLLNFLQGISYGIKEVEGTKCVAIKINSGSEYIVSYDQLKAISRGEVKEPLKLRGK